MSPFRSTSDIWPSIGGGDPSPPGAVDAQAQLVRRRPDGDLHGQIGFRGVERPLDLDVPGVRDRGRHAARNGRHRALRRGRRGRRSGPAHRSPGPDTTVTQASGRRGSCRSRMIRAPVESRLHRPAQRRSRWLTRRRARHHQVRRQRPAPTSRRRLSTVISPSGAVPCCVATESSMARSAPPFAVGGSTPTATTGATTGWSPGPGRPDLAFDHDQRRQRDRQRKGHRLHVAGSPRAIAGIPVSRTERTPGGRRADKYRPRACRHSAGRYPSSSS